MPISGRRGTAPRLESQEV